MKIKDRERVIKFVNNLQKSLKLQDWVININFEGSVSADAYATMDHFGDSKHAELRISKKFIKLPVKDQRQVLVHEMVHCHLFLIDGAMYNVLREILPEKTSNLVSRVLTTEIERTTDALADAISTMCVVKY